MIEVERRERWLQRDGSYIHVSAMSRRHVEHTITKIKRDGWRSDWLPRMELELETRKEIERMATDIAEPPAHSYVFTLRSSQPFGRVRIDKWLDVSCIPAALVMEKMGAPRLPDHEYTGHCLNGIAFAARMNNQSLYKVNTESVMTAEDMEQYLNTIERAAAEAWLRGADIQAPKGRP